MSSEIRKSNFKLLVSTFAFILFASGAIHAETFPSKEISLADWGLKTPSEIGYVSIGVLHKKEGDELIIYDIRKQRPVVKEPKRPLRRTPSFKGDVFLVSHFNQGNVNRLGGYFNGFAKIPSKSSVQLRKLRMESRRWLILTRMQHRASPVFGFTFSTLRNLLPNEFFWMQLPSNI